MKSLKILAAGTAALLAVTCACTPEKKSGNVVSLAEAEATFSASLNGNDTIAVLEAGAAFMDSLKSGNIDSALSMLYINDSDGIRPLSEDEKEPLRKRFTRFPVVSWTLDHYDMSIPTLNDLKYSYRFTDDNSRPGMSVMLNPMFIDNQWYLMMKQANQAAKDAANALDPNTVVRMPEQE